MSEFGEGSMLATTLDIVTATALANKHYCAIGGCNLPEQTVIAGEDDDLSALQVELAERFPRKRAVRLRTEGAFHTYLMVQAARRFKSVLADVDFMPLTFGVLSNYTGRLHDSDAESIRSRLYFQLFNPVRWINCMDTAFDRGVTCVVEFGGGIGDVDDPAQKRPNLEGIIKKAMRFRAYDAEYLPAINVGSIYEASQRLISANK
jgi:[acyl-carrier-protein] S-malonyltransferase